MANQWHLSAHEMSEDKSFKGGAAMVDEDQPASFEERSQGSRLLLGWGD